MNAKIAILFAFVCAASGRVFLVDSEPGAPACTGCFSSPLHRVKRDLPVAPIPYGAPPPPPVYHAEPAPYHGPKGKVGPVYTFVKTDPKANFKWGVRHVAGHQYAGRR